jgi:hypothetical protein
MSSLGARAVTGYSRKIIRFDSQLMHTYFPSAPRPGSSPVGIGDYLSSEVPARSGGLRLSRCRMLEILCSRAFLWCSLRCYRLRLGPHERTKCVRCNARRDVRCRNRKKPTDLNIRGTRALLHGSHDVR